MWDKHIDILQMLFTFHLSTEHKHTTWHEKPHAELTHFYWTAILRSTPEWSHTPRTSERQQRFLWHYPSLSFNVFLSYLRGEREEFDQKRMVVIIHISGSYLGKHQRHFIGLLVRHQGEDFLLVSRLQTVVHLPAVSTANICIPGQYRRYRGS